MSDTMVDQVIDAIAHNPLSHAADEDTDAAVMPDFFEGSLRRLLLRQDSTPRLYLKALREWRAELRWEHVDRWARPCCQQASSLWLCLLG